MPSRSCPNCQAPAEPGAVYCERCGYRLPAVADQPASESVPCPACGALNLPGELFCQACGVVLAPVSAQPPPLPRPLDRQEQPPTPSAVGADLSVRPDMGVRPARTGSTLTSSVHGRLRQRETGRICVFPTGKPQLLVGRSDIAESFFPDVDLEPFEGENMGVSRRHALLTTRGGAVYLEDLNSTNFTFLNHQLLVPGQPLLLKDGDIIQFGQLVLVYEENA